MTIDFTLKSSWRKILTDEFEKPYFKKLLKFIDSEYTNKNIFPERKNIYRAFDLCSFENVRVVILGQDPYHGAGQANGLAFSVSKNISLPPSLKNIFKEMENDLKIKTKTDGDLSYLAKQGVLLLNSTLTVCENQPGSHQNRGWELFTDAVLRKLSDEKENLVFILWGNYAKEKGWLIDREKHLVIESTHPSPFSAHRGFFGSRPFSRANKYLQKIGIIIDWGND